MLVNGDPLMWERLDARKFKRERLVARVAVAEAVGIHNEL
jgi:hypothetical protein